MSRRNGPRLDLKLNLSPPRSGGRQSRQQVVESPSSGRSSSTVSPTGSCVSSELVAGGGQEDHVHDLRYSSSPEATSMVLVGCPRCLMYVMLSEEEPRCPKCKSTVLLDVAHQNSAGAAAAAATRKTRKN